MAIQIDLGKLSLTPKGTWSSATTYEKDDVVQYTDGGTLSTYIAVAGSTNQAPSTGGTENASFWKFMAKGTDQIAIAYNAVETTDFTAQASNAYFVDSTAGAITITLPASPGNGDFIKIIDYAKTFHTNHVTLDAGSNNIEGNSDNYILYGKGTILEIAYDATASSPMGWKFVAYSSDDNSSAMKTHQPQGVGSKKYMIATSDAEEVYMDGTDMVHHFRTSGTFTVHSLGTDSTHGDKIEYLIVGGGGSGGLHHGAGGGAGGYRANNAFDHTVTAQAYSIVVGAGGGQRTSNGHGNNGSASSGFGLTSDGGGGGGGSPNGGRSGGSGGGGGHSGGHGNATGGGSGHRGGSNGHHTGGGGGGAGEPGADHYGNHMAGQGGRGNETDITGKPTHYAGGGGAAGHNHTSCPAGGVGGGAVACGSGWDGFGGGGGGNDGHSGGHRRGGQGGDGVVIVRYKAKD